MNPERWQRIEALVEAALERQEAEQEAFVAAACGGDAALAREVQGLLDSYSRADDFLETPAVRGLRSGSLFSGSPAAPAEALEKGQELGPYRIESLIGRGGMGTVYLARDTKLSTRVALKTLDCALPTAIYKFKQEFRNLSDVLHPNLVQLYELRAGDGRWFFTMELVEGLDFLRHVRGETASWVPLRRALAQLAEGLLALHKAGKLHCDIKPSNVLVTGKGRVVLLDFGLAQELAPAPADLTRGGLIGTPAYMSPEQAAGRPLAEASDWYSVGVVLYEALTGQKPFRGRSEEVLRAKQSAPPPPPRTVSAAVPGDLAALCEELLDRDPARRPGGAEILRRLDVVMPDAVELHPTPAPGAAPLIGRGRELRRLGECFEQTRRGRAVMIHVHGSSGVGKSALVRQFLHAIRDQAVILKGRCYERESVPYKAFDALVDALARYLTSLPESQTAALAPDGLAAAARLFPVLRRIPAAARGGRALQEIPDEREQKRRARIALRELFQRLGTSRPLVLFIDDLQWGDLDSADLIVELLRPPRPPALMLISCFRGEERESSPLLNFLATSELVRESAIIREIPLTVLAPDDAVELALRLLGTRVAMIRKLARRIARESGGNPFFVAELVRYVEHAFDLSADDSAVIRTFDTLDIARMTLEGLILNRLERLPAADVQLLQRVAVAGRPIAVEDALAAAGLATAARSALARLRAVHLIRIRRSRDFEEIETYHDRVREAVAGALEEADRARAHGELARVLEASGRADPETLAAHFHQAGDFGREAQYIARAADQAEAALAFDRAARLYRRALHLSLELTAPGDVTRDLRVKLGDALVNAGRGAAAAEAYVSAVASAPAAEALELRRRAAEQQLLSGHLDAGLETIGEVLASIGMKMPKRRRRPLLVLLWRRLQLKLRGLGYRERAESEIPREQLLEIDVCRSVALGLANVLPVHGMVFATRHLLLALEAGEPYRIAWALGLEAGYSSTGGTRSRQRTARLLEAAVGLAERVGRPHTLGFTRLAVGLAAYLEGRGSEACEHYEAAERILRERCTGVTWELDTLMFYRYRLLVFLGRLREVLDAMPDVMKDCAERGDQYAETCLRSVVMWFVRLAADQPQKALAEIRWARENWSQEGFHLQHYTQLLGWTETALYCGRPRVAWEAMEVGWRPLVRSQLLRIELARVESFHLRCRAALAFAVASPAGSPQAKAALAVVRKTLVRLASEQHPWAGPWGLLVRAGLATVEERERRAVDVLDEAARGFDDQDMALYAAVCRWCRGHLLGAEEGRPLIAAAQQWMTGQGIRCVPRMVRMLAPGIWSTP